MQDHHDPEGLRAATARAGGGGGGDVMSAEVQAKGGWRRGRRREGVRGVMSVGIGGGGVLNAGVQAEGGSGRKGEKGGG